jgi:hypothetical protein
LGRREGHVEVPGAQQREDECERDWEGGVHGA